MSAVLASPCPGAGPAAHRARVGVDVLRVQAAVVVHVLEGAGHVPAMAAGVAQLPGAVDEVLLAQHHQLPRAVEDEPLQGPRGAEGPAGPAVPLGEMGTAGMVTASPETRCRQML